MSSFKEFVDEHPVGTQLQVRIVAVRSYGVFCELAEDIQGALLVPDMAGEGPKRYPDDYPVVDQIIGARIAFINLEHKIIRLTQRVN